MKFFKELALDTAPVKPCLWKRYIDDTCCIVKDATERLLDHLNSVRPSIQLIVEVKKDGMLPFLDKSYIGETRRRLETRLREHLEACWKGTLEKSAIAEHAWKDHHTIKWDETTVVDMARHPRELLPKEAIHIQMTPAEERLNRDTRLELPGCWVAALRRQEDSTN